MFLNVFRRGNFSYKYVFYDEKTKKLKMQNFKNRNFQLYIFDFFIMKYPFSRKKSRTKNVQKHKLSTFLDMLSFDFSYFFPENRKSEIFSVFEK